MTTPTPPAVNTAITRTSYLSRMTDSEISEGVERERDKLMSRVMARIPGKRVSTSDLGEALAAADLDFLVEKRPICSDVRATDDGDVTYREITGFANTFRTDTGASLGVVGDTYGVVNYPTAFEVAGILAARGDVELLSVESIGDGAKARITALIGTSIMPSADGAPNTLCHLAHFEAGHAGKTAVIVSLETVRVECLNGLTARTRTSVHKISHTSGAVDRVERMTRELLETLIGEVEAEKEIFARMIATPISSEVFGDFATHFLGGPIVERVIDPATKVVLVPGVSKAAATRRANEIAELTKYFVGGNEGSGPTAWGAYMSATRFIEAKREKLDDAVKVAKKYESALSGHDNKLRSRALWLLS